LDVTGPVIVDTNILVSALLKEDNLFLRLLLADDHQFFICELMVVELFKHKEKIIKASHLSEDEILKYYYSIVRRLNIIKEDLIEYPNWEKAYDLCKDIDEADTPIVALALELDGLIFTGDKKLRKHLISKGFTNFFDYSPDI
jgi:predicted nucleic acid-binding protein